MPDERAYRIVISFNSEKEKFRARVPEMGVDLLADSRADAIAQAEEEIEAEIAQAASAGAALPEPVDLAEMGEPLSIKLAAPLYRDLLFLARASDMTPDALATQLLVRALSDIEGRRAPKPPPRRQEEEREPEEQEPQDDEGQGRRGRGRGKRRKEGYRPDLDDRANFLEYLRGLDRGRKR